MNNRLMILLDTNIWLDLYLGERPQHMDAVELITRATEQDVGILYSLGSIKDVYYLCTCGFKNQVRKDTVGALTQSQALAAREAAWGCIKNMAELATVVGADTSDVWLAEKYRSLHADFEDNLVIAAALRSRADYLVTNDEVLLRHCPVAALDARDMAALLRHPDTPDTKERTRGTILR